MPMTKKNARNIYVSQRGEKVLRAVEKLAQEEERSFSNMLIRLLREALEARGVRIEEEEEGESDG